MPYILFLFLSLFALLCVAQPITSLEQQSKRRQAIIDRQLRPDFDGRILIQTLPSATVDTKSQKTCFVVNKLNIHSVDNAPVPSSFWKAIEKTWATESILVKRQSPFVYRLYDKNSPKQIAKAPCLNEVHIERLIKKLQNQIIEKGFVTSRVLIPEQNLNRGELFLTLAIGEVGQLRVNKDNSEQIYANRANIWTAFPTHAGKPLNLRDLEQGLENMRRLPTVSATIDIQPSSEKNHSDILIHWQQRKYPFRLNISVDDSGNKSTGKYLGTVSVAWDNPLHLNDLFYISYTKNLLAGKRQIAPNGQTDQGQTQNGVIHYSLPVGYWLLDMGVSAYHYDQVIAGINRNYHYTGDSTQSHLFLSRVLYRNARHKITAGVGLWNKRSKNNIDDVEVEVQRRRTGGWKTSLSLLSYFQLGTLNSTLSYQRGTRAFGAIAAPEELFYEGTAKMKVWHADFHWQMPLKIGNQAFSWDSHFHGQWNKTRLTSQDLISIGDRYSVRGFNGERKLAGERGWYWRNTLAWHYQAHHHLYFGLDMGRVSGSHLLGQSLSGMVLGLKGQFKKRGRWNYDFFVGSPVKQPKGFNADTAVLGFNLSYTL